MNVYVLEIEAEWLPRHVGPFATAEAADQWARENIRTGSWSAVSVTPPERAGRIEP